MFKKLSLSLVLLAAGMSQVAFADSYIQPTYSVTYPPMAYVLEPHEPLVIPNVFMWPVKGTCVIKSKQPDSLITVTILKKSGCLNGEELEKGEPIEITVQNKEELKIFAVPGAKVELLNETDEVIKATCTGELVT